MKRSNQKISILSILSQLNRNILSPISLSKGPIYLWKSPIHLWKGQIYLWKDQIHLWKGSIHLWKGSIHLWKGQIHLWKGSIHLWKGPIYPISLWKEKTSNYNRIVKICWKFYLSFDIWQKQITQVFEFLLLSRWSEGSTIPNFSGSWQNSAV